MAKTQVRRGEMSSARARVSPFADSLVCVNADAA
jgi:hypothetical protein